jgi:hypothetical protein
MVKVEKAPRAKRKNEETDTLTVPAIALINGIPGCWAARNDRRSRLVAGRWVSDQPLGVGSADIIFSAIDYYEIYESSPPPVARIGWIETKLRKMLSRKDQEHQKSWADVMRAKGHFVAVCVSLDEVMTAVDRCREGTGYYR